MLDKHWQKKDKYETTSNMGNLCCKDIPNINLSCINNGMVSSCCKNSVDKCESGCITLEHDEEFRHDAWYETFDQCKEDALHNAHMYHPDKDGIHLDIYRWIVATPPMLFI